MLPWSLVPSGLAVSVRLTPKGGRDELGGIEQGGDGKTWLKARVRAAASGGEANDALIRLVAGALDLAPRNVSIVAGQTARIKRLVVEGDGKALAAILERVVGGGRHGGKDH